MSEVLKSRCRQSCVPAGSSRGKPFSCLFQLLEATCFPWPLVPSYVFQASNWTAPAITLPPSFTYTASRNNTGPTWRSGIISPSRSLITSPKSLSPWKAARIQVAGVTCANLCGVIVQPAIPKKKTDMKSKKQSSWFKKIRKGGLRKLKNQPLQITAGGWKAPRARFPRKSWNWKPMCLNVWAEIYGSRGEFGYESVIGA